MKTNNIPNIKFKSINGNGNLNATLRDIIDYMTMFQVYHLIESTEAISFRDRRYNFWHLQKKEGSIMDKGIKVMAYSYRDEDEDGNFIGYENLNEFIMEYYA